MSLLPKPKLFPANHAVSPNTGTMRSQCLPLSTLSSKLYRTKQKTQLLRAATTNESGRGCPYGLVHSKAPHLDPFLPLTFTFSSSEQRQKFFSVCPLPGWLGVLPPPTSLARAQNYYTHEPPDTGSGDSYSWAVVIVLV